MQSNLSRVMVMFPVKLVEPIVQKKVQDSVISTLEHLVLVAQAWANIMDSEIGPLVFIFGCLRLVIC